MTMEENSQERNYSCSLVLCKTFCSIYCASCILQLLRNRHVCTVYVLLECSIVEDGWHIAAARFRSRSPAWPVCSGDRQRSWLTRIPSAHAASHSVSIRHRQSSKTACHVVWVTAYCNVGSWLLAVVEFCRRCIGTTIKQNHVINEPTVLMCWLLHLAVHGYSL